MLAAVTLAVVAVGALAPHMSLVDVLMRLTPQFAALFALGIVAAGFLAAGERVRSWPWHWLALAAALPVIATIAWYGSVWTIGHHLFWVDLALGPAIACLLVAVATGQPARVVRLLDTRPLRSLGSFSYSLYLTHLPIVVAVNEFVLAGRIRQGVPSFLVSVAILVPGTILFARLFATWFELPFQRYRGWDALRAAMHRPRASAGCSPVDAHRPSA